MSAQSLANEILEIIFTLSSSTELMKCRNVCRRWRELIDTNSRLSDRVWRDMCRRDYKDTYEVAYSKAKLSWQELYKSLSLWSKLEHAEVKCVVIPTATVPYKSTFQILQNSVIGIPQYDLDTPDYVLDHATAIIYIDLDTLEVCGKESLEFKFGRYKENDMMIAVVCSSGELCVRPKANKECYYVEKVEMDTSHYNVHNPEQFELFDNKVIFMSHRNFIIVTVEYEDDDISVDTEFVVEKLGVSIVAMRSQKEYGSKDKIRIVFDDGGFCKVYSCNIVRNELVRVSVIDKRKHDKLVAKLLSYGFKWTLPEFYPFMKEGVYKNKNITSNPKTRFQNKYIRDLMTFSHGDITMIGTEKGILHMYYKLPSLQEDIEPTRSFNLIEMFKIEPKYTTYSEVRQVDVVEILNGHKVIMRVDEQVYILELLHNQKDGFGGPGMSSTDSSQDVKKQRTV